VLQVGRFPEKGAERPDGTRTSKHTCMKNRHVNRKKGEDSYLEERKLSRLAQLRKRKLTYLRRKKGEGSGGERGGGAHHLSKKGKRPPITYKRWNFSSMWGKKRKSRGPSKKEESITTEQTTETSLTG